MHIIILIKVYYCIETEHNEIFVSVPIFAICNACNKKIIDVLIILIQCRFIIYNKYL